MRPACQTNPGAGLLTSLRSAKDQARVIATQYPSFHMFWRLHAALPTYIAYYERGGWPTVSGSEKIEPGDKGPRVKQVAERLLATGELPVLGRRSGTLRPGARSRSAGGSRSRTASTTTA